ncbi:MAG: hypothetical protein FJW40_22300 [Acidobacteria bacterium]|nr:hypothetical protein [Acidobacteriota bacterium]
MEPVWMWGAVAAVALATVFAAFAKKLLYPADQNKLDPAWLEAFDVAHYRPMERLLDDSDVEFLCGLDGFRPGMDTQLLRTRRRLFRGYLRALTRDFNRLAGFVRLMLVFGEEDRPDLAAALLRLRWQFTLAVLALQLRLELHRFGLATVDASPVIGMLGSLRGAMAAGHA